MAAQPKAKAAAKGEAKKIHPKTLKEEVEAYMQDMLKSAANARSANIKLTNVPYGKDLAKELLDFAEATEAIYKELQQALEKDKKVLEEVYTRAKAKEEEGAKAKAWIVILTNWDSKIN